MFAQHATSTDMRGHFNPHSSSSFVETQQHELDSLFQKQVSQAIPKAEKRLDDHRVTEISVPNRMQEVAQRYFKEMDSSLHRVDRMFDGTTSERRIDGSREFVRIRKACAKDLFSNVVKPKIEQLLRKHGETRSFDEMVTVFGFNRLFMREAGSAGTDIDFFMLVDTNKADLMEDIRSFMKGEIAPAVKHMGIDMETAKYLMIDTGKYSGKLSDTRKSLFTLANQGQVDHIVGSRTILADGFTFTNKQLAHHYVTLLLNNGSISEHETDAMKEKVEKKIASNPRARRYCQNILQQMASSELYIGKHPYGGKKTIQTELTKISLEARSERTAKISIKYNFLRIADMYNTTNVDPSRRILSQTEVRAVEELGTVLSNIKCRIDDEGTHPLLKVQENYSNLTLKDLRKMSMSDRIVVSRLLGKLGLQVDPKSDAFPAKAYDALWTLSDKMGRTAVALEKEIYSNALQFMVPTKSQTISSYAVHAAFAFAFLGILYRKVTR